MLLAGTPEEERKVTTGDRQGYEKEANIFPEANIH